MRQMSTNVQNHILNLICGIVLTMFSVGCFQNAVGAQNEKQSALANPPVSGTSQVLACYTQANALNGSAVQSSSVTCAGAKTPTAVTAVLDCYTKALQAQGGDHLSSAILCANATTTAIGTAVLACYAQAWNGNGGNIRAASTLCSAVVD